MAIHRRMPDIAQKAAKDIGRTLEEAVRGARSSWTGLFDHDYVPIPNTRPQKFTTKFDALTDKDLSRRSRSRSWRASRPRWPTPARWT
jgi:methyl-accepting chemotaxis protein